MEARSRGTAVPLVKAKSPELPKTPYVVDASCLGRVCCRLQERQNAVLREQGVSEWIRSRTTDY